MNDQATEALKSYLNSYLILALLVGGILGGFAYARESTFLWGIGLGVGAFSLLFFMDLTRLNYSTRKQDDE